MPTDKISTLPTRSQPNNYSPYGLRNAERESTSALAFNGEFLSAALECYALGNGHRLYSSRLMRFINPDTLSPFLKGGINAYAYCLNDPVNATDPSGKFRLFGTLAKAGHTFKDIAITLINHQASDLAPEMMHLKRQIKKATTIFKHVTSIHSLNDVDSTYNHKFALTKDNKFVIGSSYSDDRAPSHASIAEHSDSSPGASDTVISAGYIYTKGGNLYINNYSGHYKPSVESLEAAKNHLQALNISTKIVRANVGSSSWEAASGALS